MDDLRPYICTFQNCSQPGETYASRAAFLDHEISVHRDESSGSEIGEPLLPRPCVFCEAVLSMADPKDCSQHVAHHMEEIAFTVVTNPYEDWDFDSDAASVKYQATYNSRNTTASYDAKGDEDTTCQIRRMQGVSCPMCKEEKTFSGCDALRRHMRRVHPTPVILHMK